MKLILFLLSLRDQKFAFRFKHCSMTVTEEHSIFGSLQGLDLVDGTLSILVVIVSVLLLEHLFHQLHSLTHDTPFQDMVSAIEKELMIVGFMAFVFKIIVNSSKLLNSSWLAALEFSGLFHTIRRIYLFVICSTLSILFQFQICWFPSYLSVSVVKDCS